ncbi:hypothetical protein Taro_002374 [Colocasia esculenta]|uniref:Uncharacterized protein n=1 Tax=Colocasia esculenta TaxID=4460 RepID=A0A843TLC0_COLES|nr:hypothetical protein [Colocasia esculenta]
MWALSRPAMEELPEDDVQWLRGKGDGDRSRIRETIEGNSKKIARQELLNGSVGVPAIAHLLFICLNQTLVVFEVYGHRREC